jgi:hypothetical protein
MRLPTLIASSIKCVTKRIVIIELLQAAVKRHVTTTRQLLRKVLDLERFVFYPQGDGRDAVVRHRGDADAGPVLCPRATLAKSGFVPLYAELLRCPSTAPRWIAKGYRPAIPA